MTTAIIVSLVGDNVDVLSIDGGILASGDIETLADGSVFADMSITGNVYVPSALFDADGELSATVTAADDRSFAAAVAKWWTDLLTEAEMEQQWMWQQQQDAYAEEIASMERWVQDDEEQVQP